MQKLVYLITLMATVPIFAEKLANGQTYSARDLEGLGGLTGTTAVAINNNGQVVGNSFIGQFGGGGATCGNGQCPIRHAFLWTSGTMIDLGLPQGAFGIDSSGNCINNASQVVGNYVYPSYFNGSLLYSGSVTTDLMSGVPSSAQGINNTGQIVGAISTTGGEFASYHAYLKTGAALIDLGTLGGQNSAGNAVNDAAQVVGEANLEDGSFHAFLYTGAMPLRDLGTLGGTNSFATAINTNSQIVGWANTPSASQHAFYYDANTGGLIDLGTLGGMGSQADGINIRGQIVGWANANDGSQHAFIANGATGLIDLNTLVTLPSGVQLVEATGINDAGQIIANGSDGHAYLLTPASNPTCNPPGSILTDDTGTGGFAVTTPSNMRLDQGMRESDIRVQNYARLWLGVDVLQSPGTQFKPDLNTGIEGAVAALNLVPACRSGFSLQPPFVSCMNPGVASWTASFCSAGKIEMDLSLTPLSAAVSMTDILVGVFLKTQPINTVVSVTNQLYTTVPAYKKAADCLVAPGGLTQSQNVSCVSSALLTLARDSQQRQSMQNILALNGINIGLSALVSALLDGTAGIVQAFGDLVVLDIQTGLLGHTAVEIINVQGQ